MVVSWDRKRELVWKKREWETGGEEEREMNNKLLGHEIRTCDVECTTKCYIKVAKVLVCENRL